MDETTNTPGGGLAALGAITREADEANPDPATVERAEKEEAAVSAAEQGAREWGRLMFMLGGAVCMVAPELKPVYAQEPCLEWGRQAHAVAEKYQWKGPALPELALAVSTLGFAIPTWLVLREKARQISDARNAGAFGKFVLWWRERRAARNGAPAPAAVQEAAGDGSKQ